MSSPRTFKDVLAPTATKKLLALDGGGIRGLITVEILAGMEALLRKETGSQTLVLGDYFDYVAGTSTGAIIATCISLGMPMERIREFYQANGEAMFDKAWLHRRHLHKYEDERLATTLREVLQDAATRVLEQRGQKAGAREVPTLGTDALRTLLMIVMRNASTDSPWPVSNNPNAKYNDRSRPDCNLDIPLWQLVRASTAAPTYFPPEVVKLGTREFVFVDGGITTYNNPAFILFLMATTGAYRLGWPTGADRMLLVSVGTGTSPEANKYLDPTEMNILYNAGSIPSALMFAALNEQDMLCRIFGACRHGASIDEEVGTLMDGDGACQGLAPKLFTYARYNVELTRVALNKLGLHHIQPEHVQKLDSIAYIPELQEVGGKVAGQVNASHFSGFLDASR